MWKVNLRKEDAKDKIFQLNVELFYMTTAEEKHDKDNAPPMERENMEEMLTKRCTN